MTYEVMELRRLNTTEEDVIIRGLKALLGTDSGWAAKALLDDDAEFVRGLFWTSKK
jgi:hypothetical protein